MLKKISIVLMSVILILNVGSVAFAQDLETPLKNKTLKLQYSPEGELLQTPVGEAEYIDTGKGDLIKISDLFSFETEEEAAKFLETITSELSKSIQFNAATQITPMATYGDTLVSRKIVSFTAYINLRVSYTTSGNSNTGYITSHNAYTTFTGFNLGFGWDERICYSQITSSGKDIYAYTSGTLDFYLLVDGFIRLYSKPVTLSGYAYAIR